MNIRPVYKIGTTVKVGEENRFIQVYRKADLFWVGDFTPAGAQKVKDGEWLAGEGPFMFRRDDGTFLEMDGTIKPKPLRWEVKPQHRSA